ncbi:hypothetical protein GGI04_000175 [Coemansia thaxteri]|uniref:Tetratricopeptide SHNi-TPR domain-containing protein n=1 Tax=Coemansia thaxteri TaxID=2663907 RepID=A0A9W8BLZ4_9FUNG|nr:hypothetical protein H4R26_001306 [Coemansia thaxteri]KAJ2009763.1 hypothetical protein GGI04_000175 [Coemansia thaxteri]KAJ2474402.1 hypothetical protein GGI02_000112 [Coemansia sp. RSA 2322]KAJ2486386.1 hypothetical protein EV174_001137 [Coemansia sp. RSA 2320]
MTDKGKQADTSHAVEDTQSAFNAVMPVIADLLEVGTRAFALGDWGDAIDNFGQLASITEQTFGGESQRYADCLVMYGRALLQHAIEQNALLAQKTLAEAASGGLANGDGDEAVPTKANIHFEGEPDFRQIESLEIEDSGAGEAGASSKGKQTETEEDGEEEEDADDEDIEDDFAAAWDVLDLARVIQAKATDSKSQLKYAETLMLLGDVSMESENFAQAVKDFDEALQVKMQYLGDDDRELAELYYKVALAHEYNQENDKALELMNDVQRILGNRLKNLESSNKEEDLVEAESLNEVLADVASKIEEWKTPQKPIDFNAMTPEESALAEKAKVMLKEAMESGKINDISNLVRPHKKNKTAVGTEGESNGKRKPEDEEADAKRLKSDDTSAVCQKEEKEESDA